MNWNCFCYSVIMHKQLLIFFFLPICLTSNLGKQILAYGLFTNWPLVSICYLLHFLCDWSPESHGSVSFFWQNDPSSVCYNPPKFLLVWQMHYMNNMNSSEGFFRYKHTHMDLHTLLFMVLLFAIFLAHKDLLTWVFTNKYVRGAIDSRKAKQIGMFESQMYWQIFLCVFA